MQPYLEQMLKTNLSLSRKSSTSSVTTRMFFRLGRTLAQILSLVKAFLKVLNDVTKICFILWGTVVTWPP